MKNFRFLSSLALSGMLATTIMGTSLADSNTRALGTYRNLIEGKTVLPYILADENDTLTIKEIKEKGQFNSISSYNSSATISETTTAKTGDTFVADGTEYTVVIYGDINSDGIVDIDDAERALKATVGNVTLTPAQAEAADVKNDAETDVTDADSILKFSVGNISSDSFVSPLPKTEEVKSIYTVSLDAKYINNSIKREDVNVVIDLPSSDKKVENVQVIYKKGNATPVEVTNTFTISDHVTQVKQQVKASNVFDTLDQGKNTLQLVATKGTANNREDDEVLATFIVEKHDIAPSAIDVITERTGTKTAKMGLTGFSKDESAQVVKVYYTYKQSDTTLDNLTDLNTLKNVESKTFSSKLSPVEIATDLEKDQYYTVKYIVEDQYGNLSDNNASTNGKQPSEAIIAKDTDTVKPENAVAKVNIPTLDSTKSHAQEFSWDAVTPVIENKDIGGYEVTLYKNGKVVEQKLQDKNTVTYSISSQGAGTYKLSVKVKGNAQGESTDSTVVTSEEIKIEALNPVTNIQVEQSETVSSTVTVTWDSDYIAQDDDTSKINIDGYNVEVWKYGATTKDSTVTIGNGNITPIKDKKVVITNLSPNEDYIVKVNVVRKNGDYTKVDSKPEEKRFFTVDASLMRLAQVTEVAVPVKTDRVSIHIDTSKFTKKIPTYTIEVYQEVKATEDNDVTGYSKVDALTQKVTPDKNGIVDVTGLTAGKNYKFRLIVEAEGAKGKSGYITASKSVADATTKFVGIEVKNKTVAEKAGDGKIVLSKEDGKEGLNINNVLYLAGSDGKFTNYYPNAGLSEIYTIMKDSNGVIKADDVITYEEGKLTIELPSNASDRDFGTTLQNMTLELKGNNYSKAISGTVKKLVLTGNSIYDISSISTNDIVLNSGVEVKTADSKDVVVSANSTVTINGVKVTTDKETKLNVKAATTTDAPVINVTPNNVFNNLTFECTNGATIVFTETDTGYGSTQTGTIKVVAGGKVSIKGSSMSVNSDLNIEVSGAEEVNLQDPTLKGAQNVKVTNGKGTNTTLKVKAATLAPIAINSDVVLKDYTDTELKTITGVTDDNIKAVREYLNSFGLNGKATIKSASTTSTDVTIEITGEVTNAQVSNLQK